MSCTGEKSRNLEWFITLPGLHNAQPLPFFNEKTIENLNNHTFFKMPEIEHDLDKTIQLLINNTEGKNGTVIECVDIGLSLIINKTIIIIDGKYSGLIRCVNFILNLYRINFSTEYKIGSWPATYQHFMESTLFE